MLVRYKNKGYGRIAAHAISLWLWQKQWMQIIILKTATGLPPKPLSHNIINNNNQLAHRGGVEPPHITTTLLKVNVDFVSKQLRVHLNSTHG